MNNIGYPPNKLSYLDNNIDSAINRSQRTISKIKNKNQAYQY